MSAIVIWNRKQKREEKEIVYGGAGVRALYSNPWGFAFADWLLARPLLSRLYGRFENTKYSTEKIPLFLEKFQIDMSQFEDRPFQSFNDFFTRRFKPGMRNFAGDSKIMPAPCEARYFAFAEINEKTLFPVKGEFLSAAGLLGPKYAKLFQDGPGFIARLCPTDYHRFHFPDDGKTLDSYTIHGKLHSVNPVALRKKADILLTNERHVSILDTQNFGLLAYVEVGALFVGKIVQSYQIDANFSRGQEKGYFLFGGSTVVVLGQKGAWLPDEDLLHKTAQGMESLICLGDGIAKRL